MAEGRSARFEQKTTYGTAVVRSPQVRAAKTRRATKARLPRMRAAETRRATKASLPQVRAAEPRRAAEVIPTEQQPGAAEARLAVLSASHVFFQNPGRSERILSAISVFLSRTKSHVFFPTVTNEEPRLFSKPEPQRIDHHNSPRLFLFLEEPRLFNEEPRL